MKANTKVLALMTALAAGVASAATPTASTSTEATTDIFNVATATYNDPSGTSGNAASNTVTTTVKDMPGFDIVYRDGTDGDTGAPTAGNTAATASTNTTNKAVTTAPEGVQTTLETPYYVVNNGNTPQTITLTSNTDGSTATPTVAYYIDTNEDGELSTTEKSAGAKNSVSLPYGGVVSIIQVLTTPATPAANDVYAATPVGSGKGFNTTTKAVIDPQQESASTLGLQFARIDVKAVATAIGPKDDPTNSVTTPSYNGTATSSSDTALTSVAITDTGDNQDAKLNPQNTGTTGTVTFTNTVKNTGALTDTLTVSATGSDTTPTYYTPTGTAVTTAGVTVSITPAGGGTPYDVTYKLVGNNLVIVGLKAGDSASFQEKLDYTAAGAGAGTPQVTTLTVTSTNTPSKTDTTSNTIYAPVKTAGLAFGDPPTSGDPVPAPVGTPPTGVPGNPSTPVQNDPATCTTGTTSYVLMQIKNTGNIADTYTVTGTAPMNDAAGTAITPTPTVTYYVDNGRAGVLEEADTALTSNTTPSVAPGATLNLIGAVTVPCTAGNQTITLTQTATSTTDINKTVTDNNDTITVGTKGKVYLAKFTQAADPLSTTNPAKDIMYVNQPATGDPSCVTTSGPSATNATQIGNPVGFTCALTSYLPGTTYQYKIIAKNTFNGNVTNFVLKDNLAGKPFDFSAVSGTCSVNGGTAVAATLSASNELSCPSTTLGQNGTEVLTVTVKIK